MRRDNEFRNWLIAAGCGFIIGVLLGISIGLGVATWLQ